MTTIISSYYQSLTREDHKMPDKSPLEIYYDGLENYRAQTGLKGPKLSESYKAHISVGINEHGRYEGTLPSEKTCRYLAKLILDTERHREGRLQQLYKPRRVRVYAELYLSNQIDKDEFYKLI